MLPLPTFSLECPDTLAEAARLGAEPGAAYVAGGTDLLPSMKHRLFAPRVLVSLSGLAPLRHVSARADGSMSIGAGVSLRELGRHPDVRARFPALSEAARTVATPHIQAMGTLGGNLLLDTRCMYYNQPAGWREALGGCLKCEGTVCHVAPKGKGCYAAHSADTVPVLTLLGAVAVFATAGGEVRVPVAELYGTDGMDWLRRPAGALLERVELPAHQGAISYRKLRDRGAIDYALLLTAVTRDASGYRAVMSAVGPRPLALQAEGPAALVELAMRSVQPLATHLQAVTWRKKMVRVELERAIAALP